MARRIKAGIKRRETDAARNQFPKCSPPPDHTKRFKSWVEKRREREEIEATWWKKKESPKQERAVKPVISLLSKNGY